MSEQKREIRRRLISVSPNRKYTLNDILELFNKALEKNSMFLANNLYLLIEFSEGDEDVYANICGDDIETDAEFLKRTKRQKTLQKNALKNALRVVEQSQKYKIIKITDDQID